MLKIPYTLTAANDNKLVLINMTTTYPNLKSIITTLQERKDEVNDEQQKLIDKWVKSLHAVDQEMRKLERLDKFSSAVSDKKESSHS